VFCCYAAVSTGAPKLRNPDEPLDRSARKTGWRIRASPKSSGSPRSLSHT
jgi:hypothetical protein